jgi:ectoine hydroxylase-related dioxygenase (phytanoyl-CoA dioxygenase family)
MASLSKEEVERFHSDGFLGPFTALEPEAMRALRPQITELLATKPNPYPDREFHARHVPFHHNRFLDSPLAFSLSTHHEIISRMTSIYGPDLLLWRAHFFDKGPGAKEIPWHQDYNYWPLEPSVIISAWLAIDRVTAENACLQIIPGSHRNLLPHIPATPDMAFVEMADPALVDPSTAVDIELEPGQFVLFNERVLHHSHVNQSTLPRCGLSIRVIPPIVRVLTYDSQNHYLPVVHGRDTMGFNRLLPPRVETR